MDKFIVSAETSDLLDSVVSWCNNLYDEKFSKYFSYQKELYGRLEDTFRPISDSELEHILSQLPLDLFAVSESLNDLRLSAAVLKLSIKRKLKTVSKSSIESTQIKRDEDAELSVIDDKILLEAFNATILRVENQISFSRELIMSAKKIWDGRRKTDTVNPVSEQSYDSSGTTGSPPAIPTYQITCTKEYIK